MARFERQRFSIERGRKAAKTALRLVSMLWEKEKFLFSITVIAIAVPSVVPFLNAYIYKLVIDTVISNIASNTIDTQQLMFLIAARIITYFAQDAAFSTQNYVEKLMWTKFPIHINELIFKRLATLDIQYFEDANFRNSLEKMKDSVVWRTQNLVSNLLYAFQSFIQFSIALIAIVTLNWLLVFIILLIAIPEFIYQLYESKAEWSIWDWSSPKKKRYTYLAWLLQDAPSVKELKLFALPSLFTKEATDIQREFYAKNAKLTRKSYFFQLLFNVFSLLLFVGVEIFVIFQAFMRVVTIGDISFYTQVVSNFQNGVGGLLRNVSAVFQNSLYVQSIFDVVDAPPLLTLPTNPVTLDFSKAPLIEFKNVNFHYPFNDKMILENFSLTIKPGEKIAFVGENGAGKSTIIKLLVRFYDVSGGAILINGTDIRELDIQVWRQAVGVLFQDFNRYEDTVRKNIYYGNVTREEDQTIIEQAAADSGAKPVIDDFAAKYDQMLGKTFEEGVELSSGQWQKVALARAYFRNAPVLVLDEPTASIDARAEHEIFERVKELSKDKTVIIISHRFSTVRMSDRIIVINEGRIVEQGSHEDLMGIKGLYADLFTLQAKGYM